MVRVGMWSQLTRDRGQGARPVGVRERISPLWFTGGVTFQTTEFKAPPQDMITLPEVQEERVSALLSPREVSTYPHLVFHGSGPTSPAAAQPGHSHAQRRFPPRRQRARGVDPAHRQPGSLSGHPRGSGATQRLTLRPASSTAPGQPCPNQFSADAWELGSLQG